MIVIATGPESNGTRLLARILDSGTQLDKIVLHLSLPSKIGTGEGGWWDWRRMDVLYAVVLRDPEVAARSSVAALHAPDYDTALAWQHRARRELTGLKRARPDRAILVSYEQLVHDPVAVIDFLDDFLRCHGYAGAELTSEPIRDENAKWAGPAEQAS